MWTGTISNDLEYIVSGGIDNLLNVWAYSSNKLIKSIKLNDIVSSCNFKLDLNYFMMDLMVYLSI